MDFTELETAQQEKFSDAVLQMAINFAGQDDGSAEERLGGLVVSQDTRIPDRLWDMMRVLDNSGVTGGTVAYTDIDIDAISQSDIVAQGAGSFVIIADGKYPDLGD